MNRFIVPALVTFAILAAAIPAPVSGCAIAPRKGLDGNSVQTTSEQAVIIYDETTQTEHFIRTASFAGSSADFGFLVPTPTKPEIAEADEGIYNELAFVTKPRIEVRKVKRSNFPPSIGCGAPGASNFDKVAGQAFPTPKADVTVVDQRRVGNLDYAILQAETTQALRDWFVKNGYDDRPELNAWLKDYIARKWYITAFKVAADLKGPVLTTKENPNAAPKTIALTGTTVRMSFKVDRPFYPYREPSDVGAMTAPGGRLLRVYVLASTISAGLIGFENGQQWPGKTVWAGIMPAESTQTTMAKAKLTDKIPANKGWFLTEFEDRSSPRPGSDELYFGPAPNQSPVERPPTIRYEYYDTTSEDYAMFFGITFVTALAFTMGVVAIVRRLKAKKTA